MFISTPIIIYLTNHLYRLERITLQQRDSLVLQDRHLNVMVTIGAVVILAAANLGQ